MLNRKSYMLPRVAAATALNILDAAGPATALLAAAGMTAEVDGDGRFSLIVPDPQQPGRDRDKLVAAYDALRQAHSAAGHPVSPQDRAISRHLARHAPLPAMVMTMLYQAAGGVAPDRAAQPVAEDTLALIRLADLDALAEAARLVLWRAPAARIGVADTGDMVVVRLAESIDLESTFAGLEIAGRIPGLTPLRTYAADEARLCLPPDRVPPADAVPATARILSGLSQTGPGRALIALREADGSPSVYAFDLPEAPPPLPIGGDIAVAWREMKLDGGALAQLRDRMSELPDVGHRIRIARIAATGSIRSPELIQATINDLEHELALIEGLEARQTTLLRFSHRQLPALVDGLRRLPVRMIDRGLIRYAFHATATEPLGVHFLLYSESEVSPDLPLPESLWRDSTEDRPIVYWIDPAWARIYQGGTAEVKSLVMLPRDHLMVPALHSFAQVDMDRFLRETIGRWYPAPDGRGIAVAESPIYLFSPSADPDFELAVEVLDQAAFVPFRERVGFINSNLLLLDSLDTAEFMREGARLDYRRKLLETLARTGDTEGNLTRNFEAGLKQSMTGHLSALRSEVEFLGGWMTRMTALVEQLAAESAVMQRHVEQAVSQTLAREGLLRAMADSADAIAAERGIIDQRLSADMLTTEALVISAGERLAEAEQRLASLRQRLERMRQ